MTAVNGPRARIDTNRWLKPIVVVLAFAAGHFGVLPFLVPEWGCPGLGTRRKGHLLLSGLAGAASRAWSSPPQRGATAGGSSDVVFAVGSIIST